ncbi:MAG: PRD domain-containing protein [Oscillospiraceae bacterium]|nr:PRD domain-containing protein [Oscillospiraceae bacterium]
MRILKVINNNVVSASDTSGHEIVVMGRGIGFQKKTGQNIADDKIEKVFRMDDQKSADRLKMLLADIPLEHIQVSSKIIDYTNGHINKKLNKNIYITLTDHISFAIERYKQGLNFSNPLLYEVKVFYKSEFAIGMYALNLIKSCVGIELPKDEAASIALHIVNAEYNAQIGEMMGITKLIRNILDIIRNYFNIEINEQSLDFERFMTHLKFFVFRIYKNERIQTEDIGFKEIMQKQFAPEYQCSKKIAEYIKAEYHHEIQDEELIYLAVHIKRITFKKA